MPEYFVLIDDNFHFMREEDRYEHGRYASVEAAIVACRQIVDNDLQSYRKRTRSPAKIYDLYCQFGRDPFIRVAEGDEKVDFSARDYAKRKLALGQ